jgi:hypothetical protein
LDYHASQLFVTRQRKEERVTDWIQRIQSLGSQFREATLLNCSQRARGASPYFPPDTSLPFPPSKDSAYLLYKVCEVHVYILNDTLSYVVILPLVNKGDYNILRLIPILTALGSGKFVYLDTGSDLLYFDRARQHYFEWRTGADAV